MQITYTCNEDDFVRAGALALRKRSKTSRLLPYYGGALLLVMVGGTFPAWSKPDFLSAKQLPGVLFGLLFATFLTIQPLLLRRGFRKQFRSSPKLAETQTLTLDDAGLHFSSASVNSAVAWSVYTKFVEDKSNFLIMQQGNLIFVPIPKRELSPQRVEEVRSLLRVYIH